MHAMAVGATSATSGTIAIHIANLKPIEKVVMRRLRKIDPFLPDDWSFSVRKTLVRCNVVLLECADSISRRISRLGSEAKTVLLKFGESRFLLALEVFDDISDGGEAVHTT